MSELLDYISTWSIIKWIVLVLVAGFIGQFGRMTAEAVTARVRLRREKRKALKEKPIVPVDASATTSTEPTKTADKTAIEPDESIISVKIPENGPTKPPISGIVQPTAADVTGNKKALKAAEKIHKKALKAAKKSSKK